jgi:hypothetical protein
MKSFAVTSVLALVSTTSAFVVGPWNRISSTALAARKTKADDDETSNKNKMNPAKRAALDGVLNQIERSYGRGSIVKLGDATNMMVESIGTGALTLDAALGGGYPKGRVIEIYGPESSGKTTLALHAIAECQRMGGTAAFVDAEHALDPSYGRFLSVWEDCVARTSIFLFFRSTSRVVGSGCRQSSRQPARLWRNGPRYCG